MNRTNVWVCLLGVVLLLSVISETKGEVSQIHRSILQGVFNDVDAKTGDGVITVEDAMSLLTAPPSTNQEEYFKNFLAQFEKGGTVDGQVTLEEFINSQESLSAHITDNGLFYRLLRQKWGLN